MIEMLDPSGHATVQDAGRLGHRHVGIGANGAMDGLALATGNLLLGNASDAAAIEVPGVAMRLRFLHDTAFALTGADMQAMLAGQPIPANWRAFARAGEELVLGHARRGVYGYLCVAGGIDVPAVLGSRSTHMRGVFGAWKAACYVRAIGCRLVQAKQALSRSAWLIQPRRCGWKPRLRARRWSACCRPLNTMLTRTMRGPHSGQQTGAFPRRAIGLATGCSGRRSILRSPLRCVRMGWCRA